MVEPSTLPCNHSMCFTCLKLTRKYKSQCPLCRFDIPANFSVKINENLKKLIKDSEPKKYEMTYKLLEKEGKLADDSIDLIFEIGNLYKEVKNPKKTSNGNYFNSHEWTAFVRLVGEYKDQEYKLIEKV